MTGFNVNEMYILEMVGRVNVSVYFTTVLNISTR